MSEKEIIKELADMNKNIRALHKDHYKSIQFLHKDLQATNDYLYWISLSFKISVITGVIVALIVLLMMIL